MKQPKRVSLAVKVNIVIMVLVLSVSALLILISENTYQKTVFSPYFRKLENTEVPSEQLQPIVREFRPYLGTEELNRITSDRISQNRDASLTMWLLDQPGLDELPTSTMIDDLTMLCLEYKGPAVS